MRHAAEAIEVIIPFIEPSQFNRRTAQLYT
jgi:hypothetical protein